MFGRQAKLPIDLMYGGPHGESERTVPEYVRNMKMSFSEAYKYVSEKVGDKQERQKELYDRKIHGEPYEAGDLVWF